MSDVSHQSMGIKIFISYSHRDEELKDELYKSLASLRNEEKISAWHDRRILPGTDFNTDIDQQLNEAQLILLLVSADFINSPYCYGIEMTRAMERQDRGEARVVPIILRDVEWQYTRFARLTALPKDGWPVTGTHWSSRDEAFTDVARGIRRIVEELSAREAAGITSPRPPTAGASQGSALGSSPQALTSSIQVITTHSSQDAAHFTSLMASAQHQIDILQTYIPSVEGINAALDTAASHGCRIRILVLKYDSPYLKARLDHLARRQAAAQASLDTLKPLASGDRGTTHQVQIRAYDFLPYFPYHRIDDRVFVGFYVREGSSRFPQIEFPVNWLQDNFPQLLAHFEEYWRRPDNQDLVRVWTVEDRIHSAGIPLLTSFQECQRVSRDASLYPGSPIGVVRFRESDTATTIQPVLSGLFRIAGEKRLPLTLIGSRTSLAGQAVNRDGIVVDMSTLTAVGKSGKDPIPYILTEPGVILDSLNSRIREVEANTAAALEFEHTLDLSSRHMATIGGAVMNNGGGILSTKYGSACDNVVDLEIMLPDGRVTWTSDIREKGRFADLYRELHRAISETGPEVILQGYPKLRKNASGYNVRPLADQVRSGSPLDVTQLLVGSEGTLAALLRAKIKIRRVAAPKGTALLFFDSFSTTAQAVADILKITVNERIVLPSALEVISGSIFQVIKDLKVELPSECEPPHNAREAMLLVEYDDQDETVEAALRELTSIYARYEPARGHDESTYFRILDDVEKRRNFWFLRRNMVKLLNDYGRKHGLVAPPIIEDIAVPIDRLGTLLRFLEEVFEDNGVRAAIFGHAGDGNLHVRPLFGRTAEDLDSARQIMDKVYRKVIALGGTISAEHGDGLLRTPYLPLQFSKPNIDLFRRIKELFDPHYLLNPDIKVPQEGYQTDHLRYDRWDIAGYLPVGGGMPNNPDQEDFVW